MSVNDCTECSDNGRQKLFGSPCQKCAVMKQCERIKKQGYEEESKGFTEAGSEVVEVP